MSSPVEPFAVLPREGTPLPIPFGGSVTIKAQTRNTNGSLTVLEFVHSPKAGPALHLHFREDEVWYVLEGDYRFKVGDAMFRVSEGGMAFGPRGAPHGFQDCRPTARGFRSALATPKCDQSPLPAGRPRIVLVRSRRPSPQPWVGTGVWQPCGGLQPDHDRRWRNVAKFAPVVFQ